MYTVIEFWTESDGSAQQTTTYPKETKDEACSSYHYVLHQAAVSSYFKHGALIMDEDGRYLNRECYTHVLPQVEVMEE